MSVFEERIRMKPNIVSCARPTHLKDQIPSLALCTIRLSYFPLAASSLAPSCAKPNMAD